LASRVHPKDRPKYNGPAKPATKHLSFSTHNITKSERDAPQYFSRASPSLGPFTAPDSDFPAEGAPGPWRRRAGSSSWNRAKIPSSREQRRALSLASEEIFPCCLETKSGTKTPTSSPSRTGLLLTNSRCLPSGEGVAAGRCLPHRWES
jgi:hypothetical protein